MEVTGEFFSFHHKRKRAEEVRYQRYRNFQVEKPLPDRTLDSFIPNSTDGATPNHKVNPYRVYFKELFPNFLGRTFQVKGQSNRVIILLSCSGFLF